MLLKGNCLETLKTLDTASVDSIVTDPPYELGFMGKSWDNSGIAFSTELWAECLRVLKPGGHLLAFSGSRTYHRMVVAIEDSGFEIRDQIMWVYSSGFPKSLNVSKAIDKAAGAERKDRTVVTKEKSNSLESPRRYVTNAGTPATPEAQQWQGWGTALKPAHEPIVVARKPLIGMVANNVLTYGTGALNIDGSRVGSSGGTKGIPTGNGPKKINVSDYGLGDTRSINIKGLGRWPANVIHDGSDEVLAGFPNEAGRYFYCPKASKSERNAGLEGLPERRESDRERDDGVGGDNPRNRTNKTKKNFHPTVKPLSLMRHLIKLVTPPNGIVLDPFLGSGTTAVAATLEGFDWIGCEMTEDYWPIIEARVEWAQVTQAG
jgi:site-specific DNA-methyltransferase (adenine-specific)